MVYVAAKQVGSQKESSNTYLVQRTNVNDELFRIQVDTR